MFKYKYTKYINKIDSFYKMQFGGNIEPSVLPNYNEQLQCNLEAKNCNCNICLFNKWIFSKNNMFWLNSQNGNDWLKSSDGEIWSNSEEGRKILLKIDYENLSNAYKKFNIYGNKGTPSFDGPILKLNDDLDLILSDGVASYPKLTALQNPIGRIMHEYSSKNLIDDGIMLSDKILSTIDYWPQGVLTKAINFYYHSQNLEKMIYILDIINNKSRSGINGFKIHQREVENILELCAKNKNQEQCEYVLQMSFDAGIIFEEKDFINMIVLYDKYSDKILDILKKMSKLIPEISSNNFEIIKSILIDNKKIINPSFINKLTHECIICKSQIIEFAEFVYNRNEILTLLDNIAMNNIEEDKKLGKNFIKRTENEKKNLYYEYDNFKNIIMTLPQVDFVIDGANIGYHNLNLKVPNAKNNSKVQGFVTSSIDYNQLNLIVEYLYNNNKTVLIILNKRHDKPHGKIFIDKWKNMGIIKFTPNSFADDICWMYASIFMTLKNSHKKTFVITNDELRNYSSIMENNQIFQRWKDTHSIRYKFNKDGFMFENLHILNTFIMSIQYNNDTKKLHIPVKNKGVFCIDM
jgi:hypothetical protein